MRLCLPHREHYTRTPTTRLERMFCISAVPLYSFCFTLHYFGSIINMFFLLCHFVSRSFGRCVDCEPADRNESTTYKLKQYQPLGQIHMHTDPRCCPGEFENKWHGSGNIGRAHGNCDTHKHFFLLCCAFFPLVRAASA